MSASCRSSGRSDRVTEPYPTTPMDFPCSPGTTVSGVFQPPAVNSSIQYRVLQLPTIIADSMASAVTRAIAEFACVTIIPRRNTISDTYGLTVPAEGRIARNDSARPTIAG